MEKIQADNPVSVLGMTSWREGWITACLLLENNCFDAKNIDAIIFKDEHHATPINS